MAINTYINTYTSNEQDLVEDLTVESIQIKGIDVKYLPRTLIGDDDIFGDDQWSKFDTDALTIEMYLNSVDGFEGDGDLLSKFGIEIVDSCTFVCARRRFGEEITTPHSDITRPREGDLIYIPLTKTLLEITHVEHENPFYQVGKLYSYFITCETFRYNQEEFDTGIAEVDAIDDQLDLEADVMNDPFAENDTFESENDLQDYSETNPFGAF